MRCSTRRSAVSSCRSFEAENPTTLYAVLCMFTAVRSNRLIRLGAQQTLKRSPWNLRPLLRIDRQLNPVWIGLYIQGQALRARSDPRTAWRPTSGERELSY